ncbi:integrase catalytic domain-containing protein [Trichonephila clavata]|uniref:Integrase catalytic domain-containing protein n=1 Tax=Trichonephila clavata TaxID=2740835 RepID=A0A8X6KGK6_TRICU|nr:integrase catalytic domain-containing protein [Trichonephila clavata]
MALQSPSQTDSDELKKLKRKRGCLRGAVTKQITKIESDILKPDITVEDLEESIELLTEGGEELKLIDSQIESLIQVDQIEVEFESIEEYKEKITRTRFKTRKLIQKISKGSNVNNSWQDSNISLNSTSPDETQTKEKERIKLPKLTIPKFYGEISEWLNFWNAFKSAIHENDNVCKIDKFNYLRSFLGGSAFSLIDGLELTAEHYDHSIDILKERFGNKKVLINVHIDKLLQTSPLKNSNDVKSFRSLFNHIQKNIRSLESLSVKKDSYSSILVPILTKLLPPDLLLEYNKLPSNTSDCEIDILTDFLSSQLTARERTFLNINNSIPEMKPRTKMNHTEYRRQPTASMLINESVPSRKIENDQICLFCKSNRHSAVSCINNHLSLEEKVEICKRAGSCFRCLNHKNKKRHLSSSCRANVKCDLCSGRHVTVMCMGKGKAREDFSKTENNDSALSNASIRKRVMLQTIIVKISGAKQKHMIRLIIDSGSSGSYISEFAARKLQLKDIGHETVVHGLFGGLQKKEKHKKYVINLSNVDNSFDCALNVMEQKTICAPIPKLENMKLIEEIKNCGIDLSDLTVNENFCLYESNVNEIHGLIGADYAGKLFTGEIKNLPSGLVAMNTYFGWTIMGRTGEGCSASEVLLSLHVRDLKICDLWSLDLLGIKEPSISQSKSEIEEAVKDHFVLSLRRDDEGRYQVSLPWLEVHPELSDNRNIAER